MALNRMLDTSAYVAFRRGDQALLDLIRQTDHIDFSTVVMGELLFGFRCGSRFRENLQHLEQFLQSPFVDLVPVSRTTADHYSQIAASLRAKGTPIPTNDIWIAAHALERSAELITSDRHFLNVDDVVEISFLADT